jgi:hypothetical protein
MSLAGLVTLQTVLLLPPASAWIPPPSTGVAPPLLELALPPPLLLPLPPPLLPPFEPELPLLPPWVLNPLVVVPLEQAPPIVAQETRPNTHQVVFTKPSEPSGRLLSLEVSHGARDPFVCPRVSSRCRPGER